MNPPRILVDADACPVRSEVEALAGRHGARVLFFANPTQDLGAARRVVRVSDRRDAADFAIATECRAGDIVVTDDVGLAALALGRGAAALSSRGRGFRRAEMAILLEARHRARQARRAGGRARGPRPATAADRKRFVAALEAALERHPADPTDLCGGA